MKISKLALVTAFVFFATILGVAKAQPSSDPSKPKPTETPSIHLTRREIIKRLQLTDEQKQLLRKSHAAYRKAMAEMDGQLKVLQVELENEMDKPEPDQVKLDTTVQKIADLYGKRLSVKIKAELDLERKILNPTQLEQLKSIQGKESATANEII